MLILREDTVLAQKLGRKRKNCQIVKSLKAIMYKTKKIVYYIYYIVLQITNYKYL